MAGGRRATRRSADWDISRDAPYFGIRDPRRRRGKYFYVWLDAPIGYLASLKNYCAQEGPRLRRASSPTRDRADPLHRQGHHLLPHAVLAGDAEVRRQPYKVPDHVYVHGFITVSGDKMSKSRGTGIAPLRYLDLGMNPEWLRYYIAAKLNANVEDLDFNPDDFVARVNSDLVGKYVNIASRCAGFISRKFGGKLARRPTRRSLRICAAEGGRDRGALRGARIRQGAARGHGARRPRQPVRRRAQAVGARQAGRQRSASCTRSARPRSSCSAC